MAGAQVETIIGHTNTSQAKPGKHATFPSDFVVVSQSCVLVWPDCQTSEGQPQPQGLAGTRGVFFCQFSFLISLLNSNNPAIFCMLMQQMQQLLTPISISLSLIKVTKSHQTQLNPCGYPLLFGAVLFLIDDT